MSAVSDYIHYHYLNYEKYGTTRREDSGEGWDEISKEVSDELLSSSKKDSYIIAKNLESKYNKILYPPSTETTSSAFYTTLQSALNEKLIEEFGIQAGKVQADYSVSFDDASIEQQALVRLQNSLNLTKRKVDSIKKDYSNQRILNRIQKIENNLSDIINNGNPQDVNIIRSILSNTENALNEIKQKIQRDTSVEISDTDLATLNKIITVYFRHMDAVNQSGALFEWVAPAIELAASNIAGQELKQQMKNIMTNSNRGSGYQIVSYEDVTNPAYYESIFNAGQYTTEVKVRNKVDAVVQIEDNSGSNNIYGLSIKNEKSGSSTIKLADSTNAFMAFIATGHQLFLYHYLNVITKTKVNIEAEIINANRLARGIVYDYAGVGIDRAKFLLINQREQKRIKVISLQALNYAIMQLTMSGSGEKFNKYLPDNYTINSVWEDTAEERNIKIVQNFRKNKFTVYLAPSQLGFYDSFFS